MEKNCLFCKIISKEIKSEIVYEDNEILAFKDIRPQAPVHFLFVPKKHIDSLNDATTSDTTLLGKILVKVKETASHENIHETGYRTVINCNRDAGQEVFHVHVHLLGGRRFSWPPG